MFSRLGINKIPILLDSIIQIKIIKKKISLLYNHKSFLNNFLSVIYISNLYILHLFIDASYIILLACVNVFLLKPGSSGPCFWSDRYHTDRKDGCHGSLPSSTCL